MLLSEMIEKVQSIFGDTSEAQITSAEITDWLNEGQRNLARETGYIAQHSETSVIEGQRAYDLPGDTVIVERVELDRKRMPQTTLQELDKDDDYSSDRLGDPDRFFTWGNLIYLYPTPSSAGTGNLDIWYKKMPDKLTSPEQVSELPEQMHDTLVRYALARAKEKDEEFGDAQAIMQGVDSETDRHFYETATQVESTYPVIQPAADDEGFMY